MKLLKPTTLLAVVCAAMPGLRGAEPAPTPMSKNIDDQMRACVDRREAAGVVTLVADREKILHLSAVGLADMGANRPMKADDIMWIASMTKPITATAILMLQDEEKLSLDDPVSKYIPAFASFKKSDGQPANITIRHCLTHTSGMADLGLREGQAATLATLIPLYVRKPLKSDPGEKWSYCQSAINTAARVVEVVSGQSFPDFLQARLFGPLGMKDTTFYLSEEQLPRLAKSYGLADGKLEEAPIRFLNGKSPSDRSRYPAGNGGLFSTAEDYARFARMLLNQGTLDGRRYLKPETVKLMTSIQTGDLAVGFTKGNGWGIGVCVVREPQGVTAMLSPGTFGHGGAYGTQAWIDPVKARVYLLMVQRSDFPNSDDSPTRKAFQEAAVGL